MEEEDIEVIILFLQMLTNYLKYLKSKRKKLKRCVHNRPLQYCSIQNSLLYKEIQDNNDQVFREKLRISRSSFDKIIEIILTKHHGYSLRFDLSVFLYWLACGASYRVTGKSFNLSRFSVRNIIHKYLNIFIGILPKVIKYPAVEEYENIGNKFNSRGRTTIFSRALGAIDGTHIKVMVPIELHDQYINRKLDYSIQMQAICDSDGKFLNICVGYPGSVHDQRVLRNSNVFQKREFPPNGYFLLGDSGYNSSLRPIAILTPYKRNRPLSEVEIMFNLVHSKARSVIESAFGIMKTRWRSIFQKPLDLKLENAIKTVVACCVMHNICINDNFLEESMETFQPIDDTENLISVEDDSEAINFRQALADSLM